MDELLKQIVEIVKSTKDFTLAQAPDLAQQMIHYALWSHGVWGAVLGVLALLALLIAVTEDDIELRQFAAVASIPTILISAVNINYFMLAYLAPKLYIIQEVASMLKGGK